ncbi:hypothetical protein F511_46175 [Dorcoceras hygrometricum]|uniref:Uncharacterized protein n=1 Tax=Dorcoceras hygrometricum TaxID=472368 RepID=A0A2Z7A1L4_9LAMI|nr:hypothetical protein F511_46175 [Dorcoceras hygrometricum]
MLYTMRARRASRENNRNVRIMPRIVQVVACCARMYRQVLRACQARHTRMSRQALRSLAYTHARTSCTGLRAHCARLFMHPSSLLHELVAQVAAPSCAHVAHRDAHGVQHACCTRAGGGAPPLRRCRVGDAAEEFES